MFLNHLVRQHSTLEDEFIEILESHGVSATVRVRRGIDIDAGCGQLKSNVIDLSKIKTKNRANPKS